MGRRSRRCCEADAVEVAKVIKIPACQLPIQAVNSLRLARPSRIGENAADPGLEHCQRPIYARFRSFPDYADIFCKQEPANEYTTRD